MVENVLLDNSWRGSMKCAAMACFALTCLGSGPLPDRLSAAEATANDDGNPYLARSGLSRSALGEFLDAMHDKSESIRQRPGFYAAVIDAADRLLAESTTPELAADALATKALLAKFGALHSQSLLGEKKADAALAALAMQFEKDARPAVADQARFHALEQRVLAADALPPAGLPPLLADLKGYFSTAVLGNRDVRMASGTVRIINRLPDDQAAATAYQEFGGWFAKSKDPELARYGRKIEKGPKSKAASAKATPTP